MILELLPSSAVQAHMWKRDLPRWKPQGTDQNSEDANKPWYQRITSHDNPSEALKEAFKIEEVHGGQISAIDLIDRGKISEALERLPQDSSLQRIWKKIVILDQKSGAVDPSNPHQEIRYPESEKQADSNTVTENPHSLIRQEIVEVLKKSDDEFIIAMRGMPSEKLLTPEGTLLLTTRRGIKWLTSQDGIKFLNESGLKALDINAVYYEIYPHELSEWRNMLESYNPDRRDAIPETSSDTRTIKDINDRMRDRQNKNLQDFDTVPWYREVALKHKKGIQEKIKYYRVLGRDHSYGLESLDMKVRYNKLVFFRDLINAEKKTICSNQQFNLDTFIDTNLGSLEALYKSIPQDNSARKNIDPKQLKEEAKKWHKIINDGKTEKLPPEKTWQLVEHALKTNALEIGLTGHVPSPDFKERETAAQERLNKLLELLGIKDY